MQYVIVCQDIFMQVQGCIGPFKTHKKAYNLCQRINIRTMWVASVMEIVKPNQITFKDIKDSANA